MEDCRRQRCPHCGATVFASFPNDPDTLRVIHNPQDCPKKSAPKEPGTAEGNKRFG